MSALQVLRLAKWFINTPEKWTQGEHARDANRKCAATCDAWAVSYSIVGATLKAAVILGEALTPAYTILCEACNTNFGGVNDFNDAPTTTHKMVMEVLDKAIEHARVGG